MFSGNDDCSGKTVKVLDPNTNEVTEIPAAELAPGMMFADVPGVGSFWIDSSKVQQGRTYYHPPFDEKLRQLIKERIMVPLQEVFPHKTLDVWEDGFRRDMHHESEIVVLAKLAKSYSQFVHTRRLTYPQRVEAYNLMLQRTKVPNEAMLWQTFQLEDLSKSQAQKAIAILMRNFSPKKAGEWDAGRSGFGKTGHSPEL